MNDTSSGNKAEENSKDPASKDMVLSEGFIEYPSGKSLYRDYGNGIYGYVFLHLIIDMDNHAESVIHIHVISYRSFISETAISANFTKELNNKLLQDRDSITLQVSYENEIPYVDEKSYAEGMRLCNKAAYTMKALLK